MTISWLRLCAALSERILGNQVAHLRRAATRPAQGEVENGIIPVHDFEHVLRRAVRVALIEATNEVAP